MSAVVIQWHKEFGFSPSVLAPAPQCLDAQPRRMGGFKEWTNYPVMPNFNGVSAVEKLFLSRGPFNIPRLVSTFIVDTFNRVSLSRSRAYMIDKFREVITPLRANRNAPAAIVSISAAIGVVASLLHASPYNVFRDARFPVSCDGGQNALSPQASAGHGKPSGQFVKENRPNIAAFAPAFKKTALRVGSGKFLNDSQPLEFSSGGYYNGSRHLLSTSLDVSAWPVPFVAERAFSILPANALKGNI